MKGKMARRKPLVLFLAVLLVGLPGVWGQEAMNNEQIEALVAPIALYPDSLLVQVLMGSTYPLEVVEADRWAKANPNVKGDQLDAALEDQEWDASVKSLVNFPQVLAMMSEKLDWTQQLGDAFLAQQEDVMDAVQALRSRAQSAGNLQDTEQQKVVVQQDTIVIESAQPDVVYVPTYNPTVVYGAWPYPAYQPWPVYYPGYYPGAGLVGAAIGFATGVALTAAWGYAWGGFHWGHHGHHKMEVNINRNIKYNKNININRRDIQRANVTQGNWKHDGKHRKGVAYRDRATADKFGKGPKGSVEGRRDFRGFEKGGKGPGAKRPSIAQRPASGSGRPGAGRPTVAQTDRSRPGKGPGSGLDRPSAGQRPSKPSKMVSRGESGAFGGAGKGSQIRRESSRGKQSRASSFSRGGGGGGKARSGGGGKARRR